MPHILVIDDDDLSRELLTMLLVADGYTVTTAPSGDEALQLPISPPDIILTDMQMPGLCGDPLAARLRALHGPATRLIAMSGSDVPPSQRTLYDDFLLKPFAVADLESLLAHKPILTPSTGTPVLDPTTYNNLLSAMSPKQLTDMFDFCLADAEKRLTRMAQAVATGDDATYRREAHTIKGGFGMLGALELKEIAATMETGGIAADDSNEGSQLGTLRDQFLAAIPRLRRILVAHPPHSGAA